MSVWATNCAERTAIFKAVSEGELKIKLLLCVEIVIVLHFLWNMQTGNFGIWG